MKKNKEKAKRSERNEFDEIFETFRDGSDSFPAVKSCESEHGKRQIRILGNVCNSNDYHYSVQCSVDDPTTSRFTEPALGQRMLASVKLEEFLFNAHRWLATSALLMDGIPRLLSVIKSTNMASPDNVFSFASGLVEITVACVFIFNAYRKETLTKIALFLASNVIAYRFAIHLSKKDEAYGGGPGSFDGLGIGEALVQKINMGFLGALLVASLGLVIYNHLKRQMNTVGPNPN
jgi:hypothetical protein